MEGNCPLVTEADTVHDQFIYSTLSSLEPFAGKVDSRVLGETHAPVTLEHLDQTTVLTSSEALYDPCNKEL